MLAEDAEDDELAGRPVANVALAGGAVTVTLGR